ncbi:MAG: hypothetical protein Q9227_009178 [Pyrenula ochraceoflavens]
MRYRASIGVDPLGTSDGRLSDECTVKVDCQAMAARPPVYINVTLADAHHGVAQWLDLGLPVVSSMEQLQASRVTTYDGDLRYRETNSHPISAASLPQDIARFWLQDCLELHDPTPHQPLSTLPKRVLDVSSMAEPFLLETNGMRGHYAAMSYCWGQVPVVRTKISTLEAHKIVVPFSDLPKTLQDGIWWTRKLGLKYLWIDALCIIQDSEEDLEMELPCMADIYSRSTITLAATMAKDVRVGCSSRSNKLSLVPCNPAAGVIIQPDYSRHRWIHQKGALELRAWTFQEVQLSHRVLRCGGEELVWLCRHCKRREGDPLAEATHQWADTGTYFGTRALDDERRLKDIGLTLNMWYQLVSQFTTRHISFTTDRLPAFSGMASHFGSVLRQLLAQKYSEGPQTLLESPLKYLAGLWRYDLIRGLCWRTLYPGRRVPFRAPSWSWAALEAEVNYNDLVAQREDVLVDVLETSIRIDGKNPYGKTSGGRLTLFGAVTSVPSYLYNDDTESGPWEWKYPLLTWDCEQHPPLGCVCLRVLPRFNILLAPSEQPHQVGPYGRYCRVGFLIAPTEYEDQNQTKLRILDQLDWQYQAITII